MKNRYLKPGSQHVDNGQGVLVGGLSGLTTLGIGPNGDMYHFTPEASKFKHENGELTQVDQQKQGSSCFSGNSLVYLRENNSSKPLRFVKTGDEILTVSGFERVLGFLHEHNSSGTAKFVKIKHELGSLTLSPDHFVFGAEGTVVRAGEVEVGMWLVGCFFWGKIF